MRTHIVHVIDQYTIPIARKQEDEDAFPDEPDEAWIIVDLSEFASIQGPASVMQRFVDDLQLKVSTA